MQANIASTNPGYLYNTASALRADAWPKNLSNPVFDENTFHKDEELLKSNTIHTIRWRVDNGQIYEEKNLRQTLMRSWETTDEP
jgi:hypothetical protein